MSRFSERNPDTWRIFCLKCGKLFPQQLYNYASNKRICEGCSEDDVQVTVDLVRHVQTIFNQERKMKKTTVIIDETNDTVE